MRQKSFIPFKNNRCIILRPVQFRPQEGKKTAKRSQISQLYCNANSTAHHFCPNPFLHVKIYPQVHTPSVAEQYLCKIHRFHFIFATSAFLLKLKMIVRCPHRFNWISESLLFQLFSSCQRRFQGDCNC